MSLTITLIQTHLHWEDKKANREMLEQKIRSIGERTNIIVLPEMFTTGFSMKPKELAEKMDGETVTWMKKLSAEKRCIIAGSAIIEEATNHYNRLLWVLPNGQVAWYDKRHRFAFAGEHEQYTPGIKRVVASVNGWKINLQICYDLRFPVWARQTPMTAQMRQHPGSELLGDKIELSHDNEVRKEVPLEGEPVKVKTTHFDPTHEYDILLYVANWPQRRSHAWKTLLTARAIENQCYVIGVNRIGEDGNGINYSGDSCVIDPLGERLYDKTDVEDIFTTTLKRKSLDEVRQKFPFWKDSDDFMIK